MTVFLYHAMRALAAGCFAFVATSSALLLYQSARRWWRLRRLRQRVTREFREELEKAFAEANAQRLHLPNAHGKSLLTPQDFTDYARGLLDAYEDAGIIQPASAPNVRSRYDAETNRIHSEIPVTWDVIATMAWGRYEDGDTHERVTAWLDTDIRQGWRDVFVEIVLGDRSKRWVLPGQIVEEYITP